MQNNKFASTKSKGSSNRGHSFNISNIYQNFIAKNGNGGKSCATSPRNMQLLDELNDQKLTRKRSGKVRVPSSKGIPATPTVARVVAKDDVNFIPGYQTLEKPNRADLLNMTQDVIAQSKDSNGLERQFSFQNSENKGSKRKLGSKILE